MWVWKRQIPAEQENEWQQRLATLPGFVISAMPGASRLLVEVYSETPEEPLALYACWGGTCEPIEDKDWVAATAPGNTPPLRIRNELIICATEELTAAMQQRYPDRVVLTFPPERAFGTGNHGTTATCLRMLCDEARARRGTPWRLIDAGCGTGVLGLAGLRLGAQGGICYDFDPIAVEIARRNIQRNGGAEGLQVIQADVFEWAPQKEERAHVLLANLFSTVLQKAFPRLRDSLSPAAGSVLIVSGILREQAEETHAAALAAGFILRARATVGKWVTMKYELSIPAGIRRRRPIYTRRKRRKTGASKAAKAK